jgi:hypothetical protein
MASFSWLACRSPEGKAIAPAAKRPGRILLPRPMAKFIEMDQRNDPTGKSPKVCPAPSTKIFRFRRRANQN